MEELVVERAPLCRRLLPAKRIVLILFLSVLVLIVVTPGISVAAPGDTTRESVSSSGNAGNRHSFEPSISADGRYVAFSSDAFNLVASDSNFSRDVFVRDRQTGTTERVSVDSSGAEANSFSNVPSISPDGRYVAFVSGASNLIADDTNNAIDIFVHDRQTGTTERVSVDSSGAQANHLNLDPSISAGGRYVAFSSNASNLVTGDTNNRQDVFVRDRQTGTTERVSVDSSGAEANDSSSGPFISADGRVVAFRSLATNLVQTSDTNRSVDTFVHDRQTGTTERVSVDSSGAEANNPSPVTSISADGRYVAFTSSASNLVAGDTNETNDAFVRDLQTGTTERVSLSNTNTQGNGFSLDPSISEDGRYVAFTSSASNLMGNDTNNANDVFMRDRQAGTTRRMSLSSSGVEGIFPSSEPSISADGKFVAFSSAASNLVAFDQEGAVDIFVKEVGDVPPHIDIPFDITEIATSPSGAEVNYIVSVTDDVDPNPTLSCDPASGSTFPIGTTTVTCTSTDSSGDSAEASFNVIVKDVPPHINIPEEITEDATSPSGAEVTYTATATDNIDPNPTLSCDPASGSTFPIGRTTVTCTATDSAGNSAEASFDVIVRGAAEQISNLKEAVANLGLPRSLNQSLQAKLNDALAHVNAGHTVPACNKLNDFNSQVSLQSGKQIDPEAAESLTTDANRIKAVIGCK